MPIARPRSSITFSLWPKKSIFFFTRQIFLVQNVKTVPTSCTQVGIRNGWAVSLFCIDNRDIKIVYEIPTSYMKQYSRKLILKCCVSCGIECIISTVKFRCKDHSKLSPSWLLRSFVSVPKCICQCKWVSLMRPTHY